MIRFDILFDKAGRIFDHGGMAERIVSHAAADIAKITVLVAGKNQAKFEKLLGNDPNVLEYMAHPLGLDARIDAAQKPPAKGGKSK